MKKKREESKQDSDLDEPWIMTVKGMNANANNKPSIFTLEDTSFNSSSPNNCGSPSRDVNLNHLSMTSSSQSLQQGQGYSPNNSPTRENSETVISQKSIVHLKEKKEERYVIESSIESTKNEELVVKSPEKDFDRPLKEVKLEDSISWVVTLSILFFLNIF